MVVIVRFRTPDHVQQLKELYGDKESAALVDLLQWLLDADPAVRPADMGTVPDTFL